MLLTACDISGRIGMLAVRVLFVVNEGEPPFDAARCIGAERVVLEYGLRADMEESPPSFEALMETSLLAYEQL